MSATPMAPTSRYYRPGITKIIEIETIAAPTGIPTRGEIDDGIDLSSEVAEINGFQVVSATLDTPDFGSRFASKIPSAIEADDSSLIFYADRNSQDVRAVLPRDKDTHIVFMDEGDAPSHLMDVFRIRVASVPKLRTREDPARLEVQCTITREPVENVPVPGAS